MSEVISFDTLAYVKKLKSVGFTEDQDEVQGQDGGPSVLPSVDTNDQGLEQDCDGLRQVQGDGGEARVDAIGGDGKCIRYITVLIASRATSSTSGRKT